MIILEGPDGGGKTTLGNWLSEALTRTFRREVPFHRIGGNPKGAAEAKHFCAQCYGRSLEVCIQDRVTPISELIYGGLFSRHLLPQSFYMNWQQRILDAEPLVIYCRPGKFKPERAEYESRRYFQGMLARHRHLVAMYDKLMWSHRFEPHVITYDFQSKTPEEEFLDELVLERISRLIRLRTEGEPQG